MFSTSSWSPMENLNLQWSFKKMVKEYKKCVQTISPQEMNKKIINPVNWFKETSGKQPFNTVNTQLSYEDFEKFYNLSLTQIDDLIKTMNPLLINNLSLYQNFWIPPCSYRKHLQMGKEILYAHPSNNNIEALFELHMQQIECGNENSSEFLFNPFIVSYGNPSFTYLVVMPPQNNNNFTFKGLEQYIHRQQFVKSDEISITYPLTSMPKHSSPQNFLLVQYHPCCCSDTESNNPQCFMWDSQISFQSPIPFSDPSILNFSSDKRSEVVKNHYQNNDKIMHAQLFNMKELNNPSYQGETNPFIGLQFIQPTQPLYNKYSNTSAATSCQSQYPLQKTIIWNRIIYPNNAIVGFKHYSFDRILYMECQHFVSLNPEASSCGFVPLFRIIDPEITPEQLLLLQNSPNKWHQTEHEAFYKYCEIINHPLPTSSDIFDYNTEQFLINLSQKYNYNMPSLSNYAFKQKKTFSIFASAFVQNKIKTYWAALIYDSNINRQYIYEQEHIRPCENLFASNILSKLKLNIPSSISLSPLSLPVNFESNLGSLLIGAKIIDPTTSKSIITIPVMEYLNNNNQTTKVKFLITPSTLKTKKSHLKNASTFYLSSTPSLLLKFSNNIESYNNNRFASISNTELCLFWFAKEFNPQTLFNLGKKNYKTEVFAEPSLRFEGLKQLTNVFKQSQMLITMFSSKTLSQPFDNIEMITIKSKIIPGLIHLLDHFGWSADVWYIVYDYYNLVSQFDTKKDKIITSFKNLLSLKKQNNKITSKPIGINSPLWTPILEDDINNLNIQLSEQLFPKKNQLTQLLEEDDDNESIYDDLNNNELLPSLPDFLELLNPNVLSNLGNFSTLKKIKLNLEDAVLSELEDEEEDGFI